MSKERQPVARWSWIPKILALVMALNMFMLPSLLSAQRIVDLQEECGSQRTAMVEKEVVKDVCAFRAPSVEQDGSDRALVLMHQLVERMLDHPLMEVPHQPPK